MTEDTNVADSSPGNTKAWTFPHENLAGFVTGTPWETTILEKAIRQESVCTWVDPAGPARRLCTA